MSHYLKWQHGGEGESVIKAILHGRAWRTQGAAALLLLLAAGPSLGASILFTGNSFAFAYGSPLRYYRADTVTDVNSGAHGGVPALFKSFPDQTGLAYEVFLEAEPGVGIDWHLKHKLPLSAGTTGTPWCMD